jgi:hypothetical protein
MQNRALIMLALLTVAGCGESGELPGTSKPMDEPGNGSGIDDIEGDTGPVQEPSEPPKPVTFFAEHDLIGDGVSPGTVFDCQADMWGSAKITGDAFAAPQTTERMVSIGLDRQSFLDRGWPDIALGRYNNGATNERRGVILSMYYALEMGGAEPTPHPWYEPINDWDRGIGAHIDYYLNSERQLRFYMYAYDNPNIDYKRGLVVGRRSDEPPFTEPGCNGPNVIGCAGGDDKMYIRTDFSYAMGRRLDGPTHVELGGKYYVNLTYVIAHEAGHFFGFPHVASTDAIMYPSIGTGVQQRWHDQALEQRKLFVDLAWYLQP